MLVSARDYLCCMSVSLFFVLMSVFSPIIVQSFSSESFLGHQNPLIHLNEDLKCRYILKDVFEKVRKSAATFALHFALQTASTLSILLLSCSESQAQ